MKMKKTDWVALVVHDENYVERRRVWRGWEDGVDYLRWNGFALPVSSFFSGKVRIIDMFKER